MTRLSKQAVSELRRRYRAGISQSDLQRHFRVSRSAICRALTGKTWRHVPGALSSTEMKRKGEGMECRLREFFEANPREELTYDDAQAKYGCNRRALVAAVYNLRQSGYVETTYVIRANRGSE